jgi:hypothetical protein
MFRMVKRTSLVRRENEADTLVKIAEKEIRFFFVNHLNQPCVVAKVRNHYEVIEMNDDDLFLGLSQVSRLMSSYHLPNLLSRYSFLRRLDRRF